MSDENRVYHCIKCESILVDSITYPNHFWCPGCKLYIDHPERLNKETEKTNDVLDLLLKRRAEVRALERMYKLT